MRQWFYGQQGRQVGPIPEAELVGLLRSARLSADTLVWTQGMPAWASAHSLPGLLAPAATPPAPGPPAAPAHAGHAAVASAPMTASHAGDLSPVGHAATVSASASQVRPWVRYWARMFDYYLFIVLLAIVLPADFVDETSDLALGVLLLLAYVFFEPALLAAWGTTPGKALLRVRLRRRDGSKLSYAEGLFRSFKVWLRGVGLGLPIVGLITLLYSYNRLTRHGVTSWDEEGDFVIEHQIIEPWRILAIGLVLILFAVLAVIGSGL